MDNKQKVDIDYTNQAVPASARKSFGAMFVIMLGFTFFSASMWTGVDLANGLDLTGFALAIAIGGVILAAYTGALGYIGCDSGLSFDLLSRRAFGVKGSYLPSAMIALTQIGWFGVGAAMFAIPTAQVLNPDAAWLPYVLVLLVGVCMTTSAYFGIKGLEIVSFISVPLIAILGTYAMVTATVQGGGLRAIFDKSTGGLTLFAAVGLVIGSFVSGGTATPNFVRFAKNNKTAVITTVVAFFLGNTLMFCFGGVAGAFTGTNDIFDPWYPMGTGSMRDVVFMGLHVCQMMGYDEIRSSYNFISNNAARTLHLGDSYGIQVGRPASFIVLDAKDYYEALNTNAPVLASIRNGRKIAESVPGTKKALF